MLPIEIGRPVDQVKGQAILRIALSPVTAEEFAANTRSPPNANWATKQARIPAVEKIDDECVVMSDPGHGGIDPGAVNDGVNEKDLMLTLGRGLAEASIRKGEAKAFLTRNDDSFFLCPRVFRRRIKWVLTCLFHYMLMRCPTGRRIG